MGKDFSAQTKQNDEIKVESLWKKGLERKFEKEFL